jgi:soluble lytic murein transglycosylase-like protein
MQFIPETAKRFGLRNPHDPQQAFDAAARYMSLLLRKFGGRIDLALAAYNAGEGAVESFRTGRPLLLANGKVINPRGLITGGIPPYRETRDYVKSAIALYSISQLRNRHIVGSSLESDSPVRSNNKDPRSNSTVTDTARSSFIYVP